MVQKAKRKKVVKLRGSHTHAWGSKKKHRGAGHRGGRGYAGSYLHKKFKFRKEEPEHYKKVRFKSLRQKNVIEAPKAINLRELNSLVNGNTEIDLSKKGIDRVLGTGELTKAVTISAKHFSKKAKEKIEKAGGKVILLEEDEFEESETLSEEKSEDTKEEKQEQESKPAQEKKE